MAQETSKHQPSAVLPNEREPSVQQEESQSEQPSTSVVNLVDSSPEQNVDQSMEAEAEDKTTAPSPARMISLATVASKPEEVNGKRSRSQGNVVADKEQPSAKRPSQMSSALEQQPARRGRNPEREREIEAEVLQSYQRIKWTQGYDQDHWFCDLRNVYKPPEQLVAASRRQVLSWKEALGKAYYPLRSNPLVSIVEMIENALKTFENVVAGKNLVCWITRACAKHESVHSLAGIPRLIVRGGDSATTRACPLKYYYEQLLEDLKHVITINFEPVRRTIREPIPKAAPSPAPAPGPKPTQGSAQTKTSHFSISLSCLYLFRTSFSADKNFLFSASLPMVTRKYPSRPTSRMRTPLSSKSFHTSALARLKPEKSMKFEQLGTTSRPN